MIALKASEIATIVGGKLIGDDVLVTANPTLNSQDAVPGSLFIAIKGERVDGHDFAQSAFERGAVLAFAERSIPTRHILVKNSTAALGRLAKEVRARLNQMQVIAITGSQGKTTTKELLTAILSSHAPTVAPQGNFNNELGLPLSLLRCNESTQYAIVEMGARHIGDISSLCEIAQPNIGVVLRVGAAHLGEFGGIEKVAQAKSELISSLSHEAVAILGLYDSFTPAMAGLHDGKVLTFGDASGADIRAADVELREGRPHFDLVTPAGRISIALRLIGAHQISNALAAAAVAHALGISIDDIASALSMAESHAKWRMELHELEDLLIINDSYNASPDSMDAALRTLSLLAQERGGESWAFLGKMHELGESSAAEHQKIGTLALELGVDHLVCVGTPEFAESIPANSSMSVHLCADQNQALTLAGEMNRGDIALFKASRSEKLDELCSAVEGMWNNKMEKAE